MNRKECFTFLKNVLNFVQSHHANSHNSDEWNRWKLDAALFNDLDKLFKKILEEENKNDA